MFELQNFKLMSSIQLSDGIGGFKTVWSLHRIVQGYLDLVNGTDLATQQNTLIEESTHLLILSSFVEGITDKMRVVDDKGRFYEITYADNPVGVNHHNELYLTFGGRLDDSKHDV